MATPISTDDKKPGVTGKVMMTVYIFQCSTKSGLYAVSMIPEGDNLPANICTGRWLKHGAAVVESEFPTFSASSAATFIGTWPGRAFT